MQSTPSRSSETRSRNSLMVSTAIDCTGSRTATIPVLALAVATLLILPVAVHAQGLIVGSGPLTVQELPGEVTEDLPVCADSTTGKLGPCNGSGAGISRIAWVAQDGTGDYSDPVAAMNDILSWCGIPSATNPCVLRIAPGEYLISQPLELANGVTVEGSGIERTFVIREGMSTSSTGTVVVSGSNRTRLRDLTVVAREGTSNVGILAEHTSGLLTVKEVYVDADDGTTTGESVGLRTTSGHVELRDVEIDAGAEGIAAGIVQLGGPIVGNRLKIVANSETDDAIGVFGTGSSLEFVDAEIITVTLASGTDADGLRLMSSGAELLFSDLDVEIRPSGDGKAVSVDTSDTSPALVHIREAVIDASFDSGNSKYGVYTQNGADLRITGSTIHGDTAALFASGTGSTQTVAHSILDGSASGSTGAYTCGSVLTYGALADLDSQCQTGL